jgi:DMSO/TMAO reductase YedYZ molybdopterin-dependent catalytic subunit
MGRGSGAGQPRVGLPAAIVIAAVATAAALGVMFWTRYAFQIRTLPERVMEWALLFISPDAFESGIVQFGFQAKIYALYVAVGGMALILLLIGTLLLRFVASPWTVWASGPALYLVAMGLVMPVTGGGLFGSELFQDPRLVNACYSGIALTYASVLVVGKWLAGRLARRAALGADPRTPANAGAGLAARRAVLAALVPTAASYAAVLWLGQRGGGSTSSLPLAKVELTPRPAAPPPAVPPASPTAAPQPTTAPAAGTAPAVAAPTAAPTVPPTPVPAPQPTAEPALPVPRPMNKPLTRDQDGSLTAGSRQPGTLSELITPTEAHYHVTKNPVVDPVIEPRAWRLVVDGEVQKPLQLDYRTLRQLPSVETAKTLECISNLTAECQLTPFGCELIGTARWTGVPMKDVIDLAGGFKPGVVSVSLLGTDEFVSVIPAEVALDPDTIVAYEMNGEVLPYEHGYPARVLVPGRYGFKSAKWVMAIRPLTREVLDWYGQRNWSKDGIVKTMTRIDVPAPGAALAPGSQRIAGIAYAADRGIAKVEFSANGGRTWQPATLLEAAPGKDAWVRWEGTFELAGGATRLVARATDGTGKLQTEQFSLAQPEGASGWNSIEVHGG